MSTRFSLLVDASNEIKHESAIAHLWFEEIISGDRNVRIEDVWSHLDAAIWYAEAMLNGGENNFGQYIPVDDDLLNGKIEEALYGLYAFRTIAEKRWKTRAESCVGSSIDQKFDEVFETLLESVNAADKTLNNHIETRVSHFRWLQSFLLMIVSVLGIIVTISLRNYENQRKIDLSNLRDKEENLKATLLSIGDAVIALDIDGKITRINNQAEALTGWAYEDALHANYKDVYNRSSANQRDKADNPISIALSTGKTISSTQPLILLSKDGRESQITDTVAPILNFNNEITGVVLVFRELSAKDQIERTLRKSERRYRDLFSSIRDAILIVNTERQIIDLNEAFTQLFGYHLEDLLGESTVPIYESESEFNALLADVRKNLGKHQVLRNVKYKKKDGEIFTGETSVFYLKNEANQISGFIGLIHDITDRKRAELELQTSEELKSAVIDNSPIGISVRSSAGTLLIANEAWRSIWNISEEAFTKRTQKKNQLRFDDRDSYLGEHQEHVKAVYETGGQYYIPEIKPLKSESGKAEWISQFFYAIEDEDGSVDKVVILTEDITQRKQIENSLRESEIKLRTMFDSSRDAIGVSKVGTHTMVNPAYLKMFGYDNEDELIGNSIIDLIAPSEHKKIIENVQGRARGEDFPTNYRTIGLRKDGSEFEMDVQVSTYHLNNEEHTLVLLRDLTEMNTAESERQRLESQLFQSQKLEAVGTMVGGIAHDFNNILQSMILYGEIVQAQLPEDKKLQSDFQHILDGSSRAAKLVEQILTFSRKSEIQLKVQTIHSIILDALNFERASTPPNIEIEQDIDLNCSPVLCDKTQINQIVLNLCNNAKHAMVDKGGKLTVSLKQKSAAIGKSEQVIEVLELSVSDTGKGMDEETRNKIFDPFFTTKEIGQGTGLGLSVIHGIVELMNGEITVRSDYWSGTTFVILIPVNYDFVELDGNDGFARTSEIKLTILLVDDEEQIRSAAKVMLDRMGHTVDIASEAVAAFEMLVANPDKYDVVVTDLSMPGMSGIDLAKQIRNTGSSVPILLSTGNLELEEQEEYSDAGINKFLRKPWTVEMLLETIDTI